MSLMERRVAMRWCILAPHWVPAFCNSLSLFSLSKPAIQTALYLMDFIFVSGFTILHCIVVMVQADGKLIIKETQREEGIKTMHSYTNTHAYTHVHTNTHTHTHTNTHMHTHTHAHTHIHTHTNTHALTHTYTHCLVVMV